MNFEIEPPEFSPKDPIFISYRHKSGKPIARELCILLRAAGIPVWRDVDSIPAGDIKVRLREEINDGLSGCVLLVTPDAGEGGFIKEIEVPALLNLAQQREFAFLIANAITDESGDLDYAAPDRLLGPQAVHLNEMSQRATDRDSLKSIVGKSVQQRMNAARPHVAENNYTLSLSIQTRNMPQVHDRTDCELDIRAPLTVEGLSALQDTIQLLPTAAVTANAKRVTVHGGAHLSVAFALGAALPSTRIRNMTVFQEEQKWVSDGEARFDENSRIAEAKTSAFGPGGPKKGKPGVAVFLDLTTSQNNDDSSASNNAIQRFISETDNHIIATRHLVYTGDQLIPTYKAGLVAATAAAHIRSLSNQNSNAEVHLFIRGPFPIAVLLGRLTNTLRCVLYEWEWEPARYVPAIRVEASRTAGVITDVLLPEGAGRA